VIGRGKGAVSGMGVVTSGGTDVAAGVSAEAAIVEAMVVAVVAGMEEAIGGEVVVVGAIVGVADHETKGVTPGAIMLRSKSSFRAQHREKRCLQEHLQSALTICSTPPTPRSTGSGKASVATGRATGRRGCRTLPACYR